jgi:hypothetical protein
MRGADSPDFSWYRKQLLCPISSYYQTTALCVPPDILFSFDAATALADWLGGQSSFRRLMALTG